MINTLTSNACGQLLVGLIQLAHRPEFEDDVFRDVDFVRQRARDGHLPRLSSIWPRFYWLLSRQETWVADRARMPAALLDQAAANDGPGREVELATQIGTGIARTLDAIHRGQPVLLDRVLRPLPPDVVEGQVLSVRVIHREFLREASRLRLPTTLTRRMIRAIERIEHAFAQLSFDFALAA